MKKITEVISRGRKFYIVKDERGYWGIEDKFFTNGILNKQINGLEGHLKETCSDCIKSVLYTIEVGYLVANGMDINEALVKALAE